MFISDDYPSNAIFGGNAANPQSRVDRAHDNSASGIFRIAASFVNACNAPMNICTSIYHKIAKRVSIIPAIAAGIQMICSNRMYYIRHGEALAKDICRVHQDIRNAELTQSRLFADFAAALDYCAYTQDKCNVLQSYEWKREGVMASCFASGYMACTMTLSY